MATTVIGGRYRRTDGVLVNAHGEVIEEEPTKAPPATTEGEKEPAPKRAPRKRAPAKRK